MPKLPKKEVKEVAKEVVIPTKKDVDVSKHTPASKTSAETTLCKVESIANGTVYVEKGVTKNMGDFNSARVTIGVTLPINPTESEIKDAVKTISIANKLIDEEMESQIDAMLKD